MKYCPLELVMMSFSCKDCRPLCTALAEVKWYFLMNSPLVGWTFPFNYTNLRNAFLYNGV